jgi:predicted small integral membrane protein
MITTVAKQKFLKRKTPPHTIHLAWWTMMGEDYVWCKKIGIFTLAFINVAWVVGPSVNTKENSLKYV